MSMLPFEPLIPPALWLLLATLSLVLLLWYARHRPMGVKRYRWVGIVAMMSVGLFGTLLVLLNPTWVEPTSPPQGRPRLTILVDRSASMATRDTPGNRSRFQQAEALVRKLAKQREGRFDLRVQTFDGAPKPSGCNELKDCTPDGPTTNLAAAILGNLDEQLPQGQACLLLSDGIHNESFDVSQVMKASKLAQSMATPIYTRTLGSEAEACDLAVEFVRPQQRAHVGQKVPVSVCVKHTGTSATQANITLLHEGKEVDRRHIELSASNPSEARFDVSKNTTGLYRYEAKLDPLDGEATHANNTAICLLHVVDTPIRVLLLEGKPYWDGKFLMRALASDPAVTLDSIVYVASDRIIQRTQSRCLEEAAESETSVTQTKTNKLPKAYYSQVTNRRIEQWTTHLDMPHILSGPDTLATYQIIMLGRDADVFLTPRAIAALRNWISDQGGVLLCYRGKPVATIDDSFDRLLPVRWTSAPEARLRATLTQQGRELGWLGPTSDHPATDPFAQLPSLVTPVRASQPKPMAVVLAQSVARQSIVESPVMSYLPYGLGRVVVIEGAGMWRWAFSLSIQLPRQQNHEIYDAFWHSLVHGLVDGGGLLPGQDTQLRADHVCYRTNESVSATLLTRTESTRNQLAVVELHSESRDHVEHFSPEPLGEDTGMYRVTFGKLPEGRYEARAILSGSDTSRDNPKPREAIAKTMFDVRRPLEEQLQLKARSDLMARIAADSGGAVLQNADTNEIMAAFQSHLERTGLYGVQQKPAWDRWWVLVALLCVWGSTWVLRRSVGLV